MRGDLNAPLSFKRQEQPSFLSSASRLFSSLQPSSTAEASGNGAATLDMPNDSNLNTGKDGSSQDWFIEGPGKRVGYEDLTAIDWIFEYNKERQRMRELGTGASGVLLFARHVIDASKVWVVVLLTGAMVGAVAAGINIASDWLGDLKEGVCTSGPEGGHFYLSKSFCCFGYDQGSKCDGWQPWSEAFGISGGPGKFIIEYIFFTVFSVSVER